MYRVLYLSPEGREIRTDTMPERSAELLARDLLASGLATAARLERDGEHLLLQAKDGQHYFGTAAINRHRAAAAERGRMLRVLARGGHLDC